MLAAVALFREKQATPAVIFLFMRNDNSRIIFK